MVSDGRQGGFFGGTAYNMLHRVFFVFLSVNLSRHGITCWLTGRNGVTDSVTDGDRCDQYDRLFDQKAQK